MLFPHRNLSINDLHLGHDRTPASHILNNLLAYLNTDLLKKINITYLTGDLFDYVLSNGHEDVSCIELGVLALAERHLLSGTSLRLLRGTLSHDGTQPQNIANLIERVYPDLDFKYIDDMLIEYIEKYDIHVMYVPDEWSTREKIYLRARELLAEHQLDKVDFIIGHNQFGYQYLPHIRPKISTLNEEDWCDMVRYHCYFGHIHRRSQYKNIEIAGSFDRLAHGEEHPKGFIEGVYDNEEEYSVIFHENERAACYKTIRLPDNAEIGDIDFLRWCIDITKQPDSTAPISIRYSYADSQFPVKTLIDEMKKVYPYRYTAICEETKSEEKEIVPIVDDTQYTALEINRDNILRIAEDELGDREDKEAILKLLAEYVKQVS